MARDVAAEKAVRDLPDVGARDVHGGPGDANRILTGRDVVLELPVAPWEAALGAKIKVPSPKGTLSLTVPPGSKQGPKLRLKGQGIPGKTPGDFYCILQLTLPSADTDEAREVYQYMEEKLHFNPRADLGV